MASKPICKYGASCYRKNPDHFKQYSHPGRSEGEEKSDDEPEVRQERRRGRGVPTRHTGTSKDVSCTAILRYDLCNHTTQWILDSLVPSPSYAPRERERVWGIVHIRLVPV